MKHHIIFIVSLIVGVMGLSFAAPRPHGTNPRAGGITGAGFNVFTVDNDIDQAFELVTADTGFTPLAANATVKVAFLSASSGDTALVQVWGILSDVNRDTLGYHRELLKVAGGDTVATDSTYHIYETAFLDSAVASGPVIVFSDAASAR